jgi:SAM-dependent methyltransferase
MRSASSISLPVFEKLREYLSLFVMRMGQETGADFFTPLDALYAQADALTRQYCGKPLKDCRVLEIGYGTRPLRMLWLWHQGVDVRGIDLDYPLLWFSPARLLRMARTNGFERALKSAARYLVLDRRQYRAMRDELVARGAMKPDVPFWDRFAARLTVQNGADPAFWAAAGTFDFVYSVDVFEHIPKTELDAIVKAMAGALAPNGVALIRPDLFTGISGSHRPEWYKERLGKTFERQAEPWDHLRENRFPANSYLNKMRIGDYEEIFGKYLAIAEKKPVDYGLGREYLTPEVRAELADYGEDELLTNNIDYVLTNPSSR